MIISWCGMRGIVTLGGALALPHGFPDRPLLIFTAFFVTLGTLVIQGMTLRPLLQMLDAHDDVTPDMELHQARAELARSASETSLPHDGTDRTETGRTLVERRRSRLIALRRGRMIGDHVFHQLEEELDHLGADAQRRHAMAVAVVQPVETILRY
jgi:CPA1 family monovalent cation:H+ antiporter